MKLTKIKYVKLEHKLENNHLLLSNYILLFNC